MKILTILKVFGEKGGKMSNKLVKKPEGYKEGKEWIKKKLDAEGGLNVTIELLDEMNESGIKCKNMETLIEILSDLSDDGYPIYKISRVCKGEESKGMMICSPATVVAFTQNPELHFYAEDPEETEENFDGYVEMVSEETE